MNPENFPPQAVIIFNPLAGRGKAVNIAQQSKTHLEKNGWQINAVIATEYAGHVEKQLASEWGRKVQLIVLVGGDGTLRELVAGLWFADLKVRIGFIPMGNANVVARELNIPLQVKAAISLLTSGTNRKIDICTLKQENQKDLIFLVMLEIGFGAKAVKFVDQFRNGALKVLYKFWGDLVYVIAAILALREIGRDLFTVKITQPGALNTHTLCSSHCVIANMKTYAKGWSLTPDAKYNDGLIDVAVSKQNNVWAVIRTFLAASQRKKLKPSMMSYQRAIHVRVCGEPTLFAQVDGDPIYFSGKADVRIEKEAFSILVSA